jgi:hypothetical protein
MKRLLMTMLPALVCLSRLAIAQDVKYNFDQSADFSKYHTYKWVEIKGGVHPNQLVDQQIKAAIDSQLVAKGLSKVEADPADLYVGYQIAVDQEKQFNAFGSPGWGWRMGGGMGSITTSTINIGTLVIDMYDPAMKQLVWRGTGTKSVEPSGNPEKNQKNLEKSVAKILKKYPPK